MWMIAKINSEVASNMATEYSDPADGYRAKIVMETSAYADDLRKVEIENENAGRVVCSACGESFDAEGDAEGQECPSSESCDTEDCPCDWDTDHPPAHTIVDAPLAWLTNACIRVDEERDTVQVSVSTGGSTFRMEVSRIPANAMHNAGALMIFLPEAGPYLERVHSSALKSLTD